MKTGDIIIVSFPFTDQINFKARPAVLVTQTTDYDDIIVCLISSVVPQKIKPLYLFLDPEKSNGLRKKSVLKIDRIATIEKAKVVAVIGKLNKEELSYFKEKFKSLVDS